ncbi:AraC family transcriptional regulator [Viridibacillus arvi]|uniref:AraC family transcriptional regulator n=1 Tax=Viridibacillus arvi TaxID=263475 RepID=UPI0034CD078D
MKLWQQYTDNWSEDSIWITDSPSIKAKEHLNTLHEFGYFKTYAPYFTERSGLDLYLIVLTIEGEGFLQYKDNTYTLHKGSLFLIHCREYQKYWTAAKGTWNFLWMHVNGAAVASYFNLLKESDGLVVKVKSLDFFEQIMWSIKPLLNQHQFYYEVEISQRIQHILGEQLKLSLYQPENKEAMPTYVIELQDILTTDFERKWTLDQLARRVAVNKYQMAKQFKKYVGLSPNEFLIVQRMKAAKYKLRIGNDAISQIARDVGIEDGSHFIELFKKREGITPLNYRKIWSFNLFEE